MVWYSYIVHPKISAIQLSKYSPLLPIITKHAKTIIFGHQKREINRIEKEDQTNGLQLKTRDKTELWRPLESLFEGTKN